MLKLKGAKTKVMNLKGATVLPGINDAHCHLNGFGLSRPPMVVDLGYPTVKSLADIRNATAVQVAHVGIGNWVTGWGWDRGFIQELVATPEDDWPTKADIDPVSPDNPVAYTDFSGHVLWVNSKALQLAGITSATPDPPGGIIQRDTSVLH